MKFVFFRGWRVVRLQCKFKGLRKSNQMYPGAAILDIWVKNMENTR